MEERILLDKGWKLYTGEKDICLDVPYMPMQVHDILFAAGRIDEAYKSGRQDGCEWVGQKKWIYENRLQIPAGAEEKQIRDRKSVV